jgi:hypothetical protein
MGEMKLRIAIGIGLLALLVAGLTAYGGFSQPSFGGRIVDPGALGLAALPLGEGDIGGAYICTPRGLWPARRYDLEGAVFVHVTRFTRVLDGRGRFLTFPTGADTLRAGQRVQLWTTETTLDSDPPQVYAIKIVIAADPPEAGVAEPCRWKSE